MRSVTLQETEIIPNKIVCVGKNYAAHIEEMGSVPSDQMTVFMTVSYTHLTLPTS